MSVHWPQRKFRVRFLLAICVIILAVISSGCNDWVARVNDKTISKEAFDRRLAEISARYSGQAPTEKDGQRFESFRGTVAEDLVVRELLHEKAAQLGLSISDKQVDEGLKELVKGVYGGDEKKFQEALKLQKITIERAREQLTDGMLLITLKQRITDAVREPSDKEAKLVYDKNPKRFELAAAVKVRHILVATEAEAAEIAAKLNQGEDMAKLATAVSKDEPSRSSGGDIGWLQPGSSDPEFESAAFSLAPGTYSPPVKTQFGWHIIKVEETRSAYQRTFEEAKSTIKKELLEEAREQHWTEWLNKVKQEARIEYRHGYTPPEGQ